MSSSIIRPLEKVFRILGWATLVLAVLSLVTQGFNFFNPSQYMPTPEFHFLKQMEIFFSTIGLAFFAFLISAVFKMILHKAPVNMEQTERYLILTCIGFAGEGLFALSGWLQSTAYVFSRMIGDWGTIVSDPMLFALSDGTLLLGHLISLFTNFIPFVYAISVYVLFKHFSQLVTFESEVV